MEFKQEFSQLATNYEALIDFTTGIFITIVIIPFLLYYMLKEKSSDSIPSLVEQYAPRNYIENINFIMITNGVPFLGPFIGAIPPLILGLMESPWVMLQVIIVIIVVQQMESLLISPQIMGRKLSLSPLAIILIVLIAGKLGGLLGIILGVPIFTMLKIVVDYIYEYIEKNRESGQKKPAE